jgi:trans-aconitate 2-methyltransferase
MSGRYAYGDSDLAARRLQRVAAMFEPTSAAFIAEAVVEAPSLAVDLGCGPGLTTRLLHRVTNATRTVGLDRSGAFLDRAGYGAPDGVSFCEHDVRLVPFPTGPADVVSCRLLLAHLAQPADVVAAWSTQLRPSGTLLLDEPEVVETDEPMFVNYLDQVARAVIAREGAELYVGPRLHAMADPPGSERIVDRVVAFTPDVAMTAAVFAVNLQVLVERGELSPRPDLSEPLEAVVAGEPAPAPTWRVRQVAFRSNADRAWVR